MTSPLIGVGDLLTQGWSLFVAEWKKLFEISIRYLISGLILFVAILLAERIPGSGILLSLASLATIVINIHTSITLADYIMKRDVKPAGEVLIDNQKGFALFFPLIWIAIIQSFAGLGGFFLFFFPGIWLLVAFSMSVLVFIDEGVRGTAAMVRSSELVKGRWWQTLWRLIVPGFVVGVLAFLAVFVLTLMIGAVVGYEQVFQVTGTMNATGEITTADGVQSVLGALVQIALVPLSIIYQVKLYHSLKQTSK